LVEIPEQCKGERYAVYRNFFWFLLGGLLLGPVLGIAGIFWCLTIIGIPGACNVLSSPSWRFFRSARNRVRHRARESILLNIMAAVGAAWSLR
jgi:hypothetical protein